VLEFLRGTFATETEEDLRARISRAILAAIGA